MGQVARVVRCRLSTSHHSESQSAAADLLLLGTEEGRPPGPYSVESEKVKRLCPGSYISFDVLTTACIAGSPPIWTAA